MRRPIDRINSEYWFRGPGFVHGGKHAVPIIPPHFPLLASKDTSSQFPSLSFSFRLDLPRYLSFIEKSLL
jgi:hypothetical protein